MLAIDLRTGKVKTEIGEGENNHPRQVVVDEARNRAFVSNFGFREKPSAVWVVDTAANTLASVITEGLEGVSRALPMTLRETGSSWPPCRRTRWWK